MEGRQPLLLPLLSLLLLLSVCARLNMKGRPAACAMLHGVMEEQPPAQEEEGEERLSLPACLASKLPSPFS